MTKLTQEEILEIILTEEFAEMKYKELTQDWEEGKREVFYEVIRQKFQPLEVLGLNWGIFLDLELSQALKGYEPVEREAYIAQKLKEALETE
jgi:hypothetical protein